MGENRGGKKGTMARELGVGRVTERKRKVGLKRQRHTEHTQVDTTKGERNARKETRTGERETMWRGTRTEQRLRQKARLDTGKVQKEGGRGGREESSSKSNLTYRSLRANSESSSAADA